MEKRLGVWRQCLEIFSGDRSKSLLRAPRIQNVVLIFGVFTIASIWLVVWGKIQQERDDTLRMALRNQGNLTRAFAEHSTRAIAGADQFVQYLRSDYVLHGDRLDITHYVSAVLANHLYEGVTIVDADGKVRSSNLFPIGSDWRSHGSFQSLRNAREDVLHISEPVAKPAKKIRLLPEVSEKMVHVSRRLTRQDGSFAGLIAVAFSTHYFAHLYREVDLGHSGLVMVIGQDGQMRAWQGELIPASSWAGIAKGELLHQATDRRRGAFSAQSDVPQQTRLWTFERLDPYPLLVAVSVTEDDALLDHQKRKRSYLIYACLLTEVTILGLLVILLLTRKQERMLQALTESQQRAEEANELKSRFLASVSHELRTPLNGILGFAELIRDTSPDVQGREYGSMIYQSGTHLHGLVNMILDLAKIEAGRMEVFPTQFESAAFFEQVAALHRVTAQKKGLRLDLGLDPKLPETLYTDRTKLLQILNNGLDNAVKFTEHGSVALDVSVERGQMMIRITDTGPGISWEEQKHLFDRFYQAAGKHTREGQGSGLGLALSRQLTELLGGTIEVDSQSGVGTRLIVTIPLHALHDKESKL